MLSYSYMGITYHKRSWFYYFDDKKLKFTNHEEICDYIEDYCIDQDDKDEFCKGYKKESKMKYLVKMGGMLGSDEFMIKREGGYGFDGVTNIDDKRVARFETLTDAIEQCEFEDEYIVSTKDNFEILYEGTMSTDMDHYKEY